MSRQHTPKSRQKSYSIALIEGDGVGPEISRASLVVLDALQEKLGLRFSVKDSPAGDNCKKQTGVPLPESSVESIREADACLKAPVGETAADVIVKLRQMLDLYANVRPAKSLPNVASLRPGIDMVIVRENTEDLYKGQEFEFDGGVVALRTITRAASQRIAKYAFETAEQRGGARKVVAVHKSNVLRKSDGLFSQVCREVSKAYPMVSFSEMLVDAAAMNLIRDPLSFDVIVTTNLYGDILSDEAAQLVGGLGTTPSANIGEDFALFEPVHGAAPDIAGKGIANPMAMILTVAMMLDWLSKARQDAACSAGATAVRRAVDRVLETSTRTPDLGGSATTMQVAEAVARAISK
ncbi:MAG TPA: isocitrate/isopropylmalate dehydrogenase family protein [Nitrososphaerales archaeon]|nr:isocitrate/isopropylmalate dehydrogenase family protein [Nitrososphaerales archaeon]